MSPPIIDPPRTLYPEVFPNYFVKNSQIHQHSTRNVQK